MRNKKCVTIFCDLYPIEINTKEFWIIFLLFFLFILSTLSIFQGLGGSDTDGWLNVTQTTLWHIRHSELFTLIWQCTIDNQADITPPSHVPLIAKTYEQCKHVFSSSYDNAPWITRQTSPITCLYHSQNSGMGNGDVNNRLLNIKTLQCTMDRNNYFLQCKTDNLANIPHYRIG